VGWALGLRDWPVKREIPSALLRAGSSLRLKNGSAQDDAVLVKGAGLIVDFISLVPFQRPSL
jgi:hypothetical protein